jgi:uncharacterized RDD family membrane protein YckC
MTKKVIPLKLEGVSENIYGGFGTRLGSLLIDIVILSPMIALMHYLHSLDKIYNIVTSVLFLILGFGFQVYLTQKYGGTPGKILLGIKILKLDGQNIGWKEAFMRYLIPSIFSLTGLGITIYCVIKADNNVYMSKEWQYKQAYIFSFANDLYNLNNKANIILIYSELFILLLNKRKRALHDYVAGTVIVKTKYIDKIRNDMMS